MARSVIMIILASMLLHCGSRLKVLSYLYEQRHHIAFQMGLIAEMPISSCNAEHFTVDGSLLIQETDFDQGNPAAPIATAHEITLFSPPGNLYFALRDDSILLDHKTHPGNRIYTTPLRGVFRPPC